MNEHYKEAIDVLLSGEALDHQAILTIIIKEHPGVFAEAFRFWMTNKDSEAWRLEVTKILYNGHTIKAIKLVREKTGLGLKEAKDWIDELRATMGIKFDYQHGRMVKLTSTGFQEIKEEKKN